MNGCHHFSQSLSKKLKTKKPMSSAIINTRATKRTKTHNIPYLPDHIFRIIASYAVDLDFSRKKHAERMAMTHFQVQQQNVSDTLQPTVRANPFDGDYDFDITTMTTLETANLIGWIRLYESNTGIYLYNKPRGI